MAKKAFIVRFEVSTRVVVDIADDCEDKNPETNDGLWSEIVDEAEDRIGTDVWDYICYDNVSEVVEDTQCPAGTFRFD